MQTFTVPRIDVLINDQLTNAVRGAFNSIGAAQLNSVLQSLAKKMTDALALANMNASESKAYGLLSRIPITASNLVVEACAALISGKDAAGNPLTGALANAASVFEAMTQVTASSMAAIISLAASPPEQITNSRIRSLANILRTGATLTAEVVGMVAKYRSRRMLKRTICNQFSATAQACLHRARLRSLLSSTGSLQTDSPRPPSTSSYQYQSHLKPRL